MSDTEKPKVFSPKEPDEDFEKAFSTNSSGCRSRCACGRECFDLENSWDWEEGELESLTRLAAEQPDRYVALPYSCSRAIINGKEFVLGCPCNGLRSYQDFIDAHAEQIAEYLNARAARLAEHAEKMKVKV